MYSTALDFLNNNYKRYGTFNEEKQTQTDEYYSFDIPVDTDSTDTDNNNSNKEKKSNFFDHLIFANQSYLEHFKDSIRYCGQSLKATTFFFIHALWPDFYTQAGSNTIHDLSTTIKEKYNKRMDELKSSN